LKGTYTPSGSPNIVGVYGDGSYIYIVDYNNAAMRALTFNGTTFTSKGTVSLANKARSVSGDGTYIYVGEEFANGTFPVFAYTFNGTSFTSKGGYPYYAYGGEAKANNGVIYFSVGGSVKAATFNGTSYTLLGTYSSTDCCGVPLYGDSTYVYYPTGLTMNAIKLCH
jgi:hypothetical protein